MGVAWVVGSEVVREGVFLVVVVWGFVNPRAPQRPLQPPCASAHHCPVWDYCMMYSSDLQFCVLTMASAPHTTSTVPPKCPLPTGKTLLKPNKQTI